MMSDAKIMTLNDLNGSEQFTKDYALYRAVGRPGNKRGEWLMVMVVNIYTTPLFL
jgi:hypothetical protein